MSNLDHRRPLIEGKIGRIARIIMVGSGKGGVGKSLVSYSVAKILSKKSPRIGLLDLDVHGPSQHLLSGVRDRVKADREGLKPVSVENFTVFSLGFIVGDNPLPLSGESKYDLVTELLASVAWGNLDYLIVDMPPGTGDEFLALSNIVGEKGELLLVTTAAKLSLDVVKRLLTLARRGNVKVLGTVVNMSRMRYGDAWVNLFGDANLAELEKLLGCRIFGEIPFDPEVNRDLAKARIFWESVEKLVDALTPAQPP